MRWMHAVLTLLLLTASLHADDQKDSKTSTLIYPPDLHSLSFEMKMIPEIAASGKLEEIIEVDSDLYPGLELELSQPDERLSFQKFELKTPPPGPAYFQPGGHVMDYYGIHMPSGQLVDLSLLPKSKKSKD